MKKISEQFKFLMKRKIFKNSFIQKKYQFIFL